MQVVVSDGQDVWLAPDNHRLRRVRHTA